jgi:hypothetical protein
MHLPPANSLHRNDHPRDVVAVWLQVFVVKLTIQRELDVRYLSAVIISLAMYAILS